MKPDLQADNGITNQSAFLVLRNCEHELTVSETRIADYIGNDPHEAVKLDIAALARRAETSEATVSRLIRKLGFSCYRNFRLSLAQDLILEQAKSRSGTEPTSSSDPRAIARIIAENYSQQVLNTANFIDGALIEAVCGWIKDAKRILIFARGGTFGVVTALCHNLLKLGLPVSALENQDSIVATSSLAEEGHLVIAVSDSGRTRDVVDGLKRSKTNGARTVAITHDPFSPLGRHADAVIVTVPTRNPFSNRRLSSRLGQLLVSELLYTVLSERAQADGGHMQQTIQDIIDSEKIIRFDPPSHKKK